MSPITTTATLAVARPWRLLLAGLLTLALLGGAFLLAPLAVADTTHTVTSGADSGPNTLRQILNDAVAGDTIGFAPALTTITLTSGQLAVAKNVTIQGPGAEKLAIRRGGNTPFFRIMNVNAGVVATISGVTVSDGYAELEGGGILNTGTLTLASTAISGNTAYFAGGGISNNGTLTIANSTLSNNTVQVFGGGISNGGTLTITNSTLSGNSATNGNGGGLSAFANTTLTLTGSTVSGNTATKTGGGLYGSGTLTAANSTVSGNSANLEGGGLLNGGPGTLTHVTLAANSAPRGAQIMTYPNGTTTLRNSLVALPTGGGANCANESGGTLSAPPGTLADDTSCGGLPATALALGPLQDNGGPTLTRLPASGSPAIDAGNNAFCTAAPVSGLDQRGATRPLGAACDSGAVEYATPPTLSTLSPNNVPAGSGDTTLTASGTGFAPGALLRFGGATLTPQAGATATTLTVTIPASLLAATRTVAVSVVNPAPGVGASTAVPFTITTPVPTPTPVPPTATQTSTPTATPTNTPTNTPVPPTATPTNTPVPPTATQTSTPTNTPVPPTATPITTPTATPKPPTATPTPLPTATPTPTATAAPSPAPTAQVVASVSGGGAISPSGMTVYPRGAEATYTATADAGQLFLGWTLDGRESGIANPLTVTVTANHTLVARFAARPTFGDVPAGSLADAIAFFAARGIINPQGVNGSGNFEPERPVARAEVAAFIARTFGWQTQVYTNPFPDRCDPSGLNCVDDELWNAVAALADYGVVGGYTDEATCEGAGTAAPCYLPRDTVNRLQVVSIVARAFTTTDRHPDGAWGRVAAGAGQYTNVPDSGTQRSDLATYRANAGPIPGQADDGTFPDPYGAASREFVIVVLWQAYSAQYGTNRVP